MKLSARDEDVEDDSNDRFLFGHFVTEDSISRTPLAGKDRVLQLGLIPRHAIPWKA